MNVSAVSDGGSANGVSKRVCGTNAPFVASMESSSGDQPKEHRVMEQPVQPVQDAGPYGPTGPWTDYRASGARVFGPTGPLDRFAGRLHPALPKIAFLNVVHKILPVIWLGDHVRLVVFARI